MDLTLMGFENFIPLIIIWLIWRATRAKKTPPEDMPSEAPPRRPAPRTVPQTVPGPAPEPSEAPMGQSETDPFALFRHPMEIRHPQEIRHPREILEIEELLETEKAKSLIDSRQELIVHEDVIPVETVVEPPKRPARPRKKSGRRIPCTRSRPTGYNLRQAVIWAEILAPPVSLRE